MNSQTSTKNSQTWKYNFKTFPGYAPHSHIGEGLRRPSCTPDDLLSRLIRVLHPLAFSKIYPTPNFSYPPTPLQDNTAHLLPCNGVRFYVSCLSFTKKTPFVEFSDEFVCTVCGFRSIRRSKSWSANSYRVHQKRVRCGTSRIWHRRQCTLHTWTA